ncbi:DegT/DnrJ/EryC1/StrS aminotransferase family protein [uncultured Roseivirga sp.]|uniref:DegT/DnrJ/EryC1/StrS family aminotransferase n=1 Tax=uncultured Roseivirga sp. TaxID=543088 RepID=UPI0030DD47F3|tara:strand:- start:1831 stop:2937 length:1107 start_codon:yes stop_codon:yes gene_type:complete
MSDFIPLASPDIRDEDIDSMVKVLKTGNLVQGIHVLNFERQISQYLNVAECVAMTNGTSTLQLTLLALGIGRGDEVIVPALSYIATANVVELVGAKPVFVDIDLDTFNLDSSLLDRVINERTKAIIVVHEFGLTCDLFSVKTICDEHNIHMIEDAACALGALEGESYAGTIGIAGSFSFHPRKAITSGEGGAVVTNDVELASKLRALRNHGLDPDNKVNMDFIIPGFNCRMTDFQAALLGSQMKRINAIIDKKQKIAQRYFEEINNPKIKLPQVPQNKRHSWQTFHVVVAHPLTQKSVIATLRSNGIGVNYGAQCMPDQTYFKNKYKDNSKEDFPMAYKAYKQGIALPIYEKLTDTQVSKIIDSVNRL